MLSIHTMSADSLNYYLSLARTDYYTAGGEPPGVWLGEGARALGLSGTVIASSLRNIFRGFFPDGSKELVQIQVREGEKVHRPGFDLTFSAPKSVSVLWSQTSPHLRAEIQAAHFEAVKEAIAFIEETIAVARSGKGGYRAEVAKLIVACFEHGTSRALDPNLHSHALVMNAGGREDGQFSTLNGMPLLQAKMAAGAIYRVHLAYLLEHLGLRLRREHSWFEVEGVPEDLCDHFSTRRHEVEEELLRRGLHSAKAASVAALETRDMKTLASREALINEWQEVGREFSWSTQHADSLFCWKPLLRDRELEVRESNSLALVNITEKHAHFGAMDYARHFFQEMQCRGLSARDVREAADLQLESSHTLVRLGARRGSERFSTPEVLEMERELLVESRILSRNRTHPVTAETLVHYLAGQESMNEEQMKALYHITVEAGDLALISGVAGSGKTFVLGKAREIWEQHGYEVIGTSLAARTARQLADESGIPSVSIAKLLYEAECGRNPLHERSILVLEEAGMADTKTWLQLARLCNVSDAKLCAGGHEEQLQPIGAGNPLPELGARHGLSRLIENRRIPEEWLRELIGNVLEGEAETAVESLVSRGLLTVHETKLEAMTALVRQWREDGFDLSKVMILTATNKDVDRLNSLAQECRRQDGELSGPGLALAGQEIYVGDRVSFTKTSGKRGIENGTRGTVLRIEPEKAMVTVRTDRDEQFTVSTVEFPYLRLAYACSTHAVQGATLQYSYVLPGGCMQDKFLSYVQISRGREGTRFYLTPIEAGEALTEFSAQMQRARQKTMAAAVTREIEAQQARTEQHLGYR